LQIIDFESSAFEISPNDFLEYAYNDFSLSNEHGYINALTNVKRAIECQCEIILSSFGLPYKNKDFPTKIRKLEKMGISPSIIFEKINSKRVDLEHFYKKPDSKSVEDAIQIAQLFLDVTNYSLSTFWVDSFLFQSKDENSYIKREKYSLELMYNGIWISYKEKEYKYEIKKLKDGKSEDEIIVTKNDGDDYLKLINLTIKCGKNSAQLNDEDENTQKRIINEFISNIF